MGMRVLVTRHCEVSSGQFFAGVIRFKDGGIVPVVGAVLRADHREMVVRFTIGISFNRMIAEQVRIRKKYPMFLRR
jgi:hypothetical protein